MRKLRVLLLVCMSCSVPMSAQTDKVEVFGGYSFERIAPGCGSNYRCGTETGGPTTNLSGWTTSLTGYFYKSLGISAQVTGGYNGTAALSSVSLDRYTYQFGPAYAFHMHRMTAFAHALFGGVSQSSRDQGLSYTRFLCPLEEDSTLKPRAESRFVLRSWIMRGRAFQSSGAAFPQLASTDCATRRGLSFTSDSQP